MRYGDLEIHQEKKGGQLLLRVRGEVDCCTAPTLRRAVDAALCRRSSLAIDLSEVDYMDSSGIHVLLYARRTAAAQGGELRLTRVSRSVARLFYLLNAGSLFPLSGREEVRPSLRAA